MKCFKLLSILNGVLLSTNVAATNLNTSTFSPYVKAAINEVLKFNANTMVYDSAHTGDVGDYAIEATINLHQFLQEMYPEKIPQALLQFIEVKPMIGANDVPTEWFTS